MAGLGGLDKFNVSGNGTGNRRANGTATTDASSEITVTGLAFTPKYILWVDTTSSNAYHRVGQYNADDGETNYLCYASVEASASTYAAKAGVITLDGFTAKVASGSSRTVKWWAYE